LTVLPAVFGTHEGNVTRMAMKGALGLVCAGLAVASDRCLRLAALPTERASADRRIRDRRLAISRPI
jgi:hypothetical protein